MIDHARIKPVYTNVWIDVNPLDGFPRFAIRRKLHYMHLRTIKTLIVVALVLITRSQASVSTVAFILIYIFCARNVEFEDIAWFSIWISSITMVFIRLYQDRH